MNFQNCNKGFPRLRCVVTLATLLALVGCEPGVPTKYPVYVSDNVVRRQVFETCLKSLPAGPVATKYNDWDEVVEACDNAAYYQSQECVENCPGEPKPQPVIGPP